MSKEKTVQKRGVRLGSRLLVLITGILVLILLGVLSFAIFNTFDNMALLLYGALPANVRYLFILTPIILVLAVLSTALLLWSWRDASIGGKIYQGLLLISLIGVSILLFSLDLFAPLFA